ncbi:MAG TPA: NAD(P)-dependent oxidoreductase [Polyangia bacterium]|nr:NAD(P)-dependent oxidoreductase [Polyangia bacterium]
MNRPVVVLAPDEEGVQALAGAPGLLAVRYDAGREPTADQQRAAVMVSGVSRVEPEVAFMRALPQLRLLQTLNAGFDQWVGRLPPGVALSNGRGAHGRSTAEWTAAVLLAHYRELTRFAAAQGERRWDHHTTASLEGKRVAVLGAGDIGTSIRRMLAPFGCQLLLVGRRRRDGVVTMDDFRSAAAEQDVVVLVLPVTPETRGLVDARFLKGLKDGAVLVNPGRGSLVVTDDLLGETQAGRLRAILDVTDPEPLPAEHPLWASPGVTITPHVAGNTAGAMERAWVVAVQQIGMFARGQAPTNLVIVPPGWSSAG